MPLLSADVTNLGASDGVAAEVSLAEAVRGTKHDLECSLHGNCDHTTGECECFANFISSNADAKFGMRADCGFNKVGR